jgi:D-alanyl-D-alanine carboxypeptidase
MRDSTFGDPAGLTDQTAFQGGPKVSAYDLAIATRNALTVPAIARWAATKDYAFTDPTGLHHTLHNHNKFLPDNGFGYAGANGFKTGYTEVAQHALVATAERNGRQCIAVILGAVDGGYTWAATLLDKCWLKPAVQTTGKFLPPIAVSPYQTRVDARAGFSRLAQGGAALVARGKPANSAAPTTGSATNAATTPATAGTSASGSDRGAAGSLASAALAHAESAQTSATTTVGSSSGGPLTTRRLLVLVLVVLAIGFVLRRRAVRRQRARRLARQRARAKAMRSGSLPVVDGRYRTGLRTGQPVDSQVRVARSHIDIPEEERCTPARSRPSDRRR